MFPIRIALVGWCLLAAFVSAAEPAARSAATAMQHAAQQFLDSLAPDQLTKATMAFADPARLDWHNIPKDKRKGLESRQMSEVQRQRCHDLLRAALSKTGYDKATKIMALENNLREGEKNVKGAPLRDPLRYFLVVFGKPAATGTWGWSFEGHHLSLNFVIRDGEVVADTPSFWGANPATVKTFIEGGPAVGTRTLADEEQLAFDLVGSLDATQRARAVIAEKAPDDYRNAGQPQPPQGPPEGLSATDLNEAQRKTLWSLLEAYNGHLNSEISEARLAQIKAAGWDRVYFAWAGSTKPGVGHYYRIAGPTFLLELVNIQSDPAGNPANHIHSVWRDVQGDFNVPIGSTAARPPVAK